MGNGLPEILSFVFQVQPPALQEVVKRSLMVLALAQLPCMDAP